MKFDHTLVIGAGGTGSHLIEPLARLMLFHENGSTSFVVLDGDIYEEHNSVRQLFDPALLGTNKATAITQRVAFANLQAVPQYVNGEVFLSIVEGLTERNVEANLLIVMAVDNHATRHAIIQTMDASNYRNFVILDPGNSLAHGEVIVYAKQNNVAITPHPFDKYPDLRDPQDHIPGYGCHIEQASTPQLITANMSAALASLLTVSAMLDDKPWYEEVHFHCERMKMAPIGVAKTTTHIVITPEVVTVQKSPAKKKAVKKKPAAKAKVTKKATKKAAKPAKKPAKKVAKAAKK